MSIFAKKPKDTRFDEDFDNGFYRGPEDEDDVIGEDDDNDLIPPVPQPQKKSAPAAQSAWKLVKPHNAQDGLVIADYLAHGYTVVMNIEDMDRSIIVRLIDFLQGAIHVLGGELRRVSTSTFVLSPRKGEITEDTQIAQEPTGDDYN